MPKSVKKFIAPFIVPPGKKISLRDYDAGFKPKGMDKEKAQASLRKGIEDLAAYQDKLYAQDRYSLLLVFQAMDAAGKDGTIKHVMSGINPQGCQVTSFKTPSSEELDHDYLWRCSKVLPERGRIGIFNRSYYEEVLITRVHPEVLEKQRLPEKSKKGDIWKQRFEDINNYERYLSNNGTVILKFFLHVSKEAQKKRFLERIDRPEKNWKMSPSDVQERAFWKEYMSAYEDIFTHTSSKWAPWHIIPADSKWVTHLAVGAVIYEKLRSLGLAYPKVTEEHRAQLKEARKILADEP